MDSKRRAPSRSCRRMRIASIRGHPRVSSPWWEILILSPSYSSEVPRKSWEPKWAYRVSMCIHHRASILSLSAHWSFWSHHGMLFYLSASSWRQSQIPWKGISIWACWDFGRQSTSIPRPLLASGVTFWSNMYRARFGCCWNHVLRSLLCA